MEFLDPWYEPKNKKALETELASELPQGHALFGVPVRILAQRQDCDDFLFELLDGSSRVAVVHLTYSFSGSPEWPSTTFYPTFSAWLSERMHPDHLEFNA